MKKIVFLLLVSFQQNCFSQDRYPAEKAVDVKIVLDNFLYNFNMFYSNILKNIDERQIEIYADSSLELLSFENPIDSIMYTKIKNYTIDSFEINSKYAKIYLSLFDFDTVFFMKSKTFIAKASNYFIVKSAINELIGRMINENSIKDFVNSKIKIISNKLVELESYTYQCEIFDGDSIHKEFCYPTQVRGFYFIYDRDKNSHNIHVQLRKIGLEAWLGYLRVSVSSLKQVKRTLTKSEFNFMLNIFYEAL